MAEGEDHIQRALMRSMDDHETRTSHKVSIVGCGDVGSTVAYALCIKNLCAEIALFDVNADRLEAEVADLQHAAVFCSAHVYGDTSVDVTAGSTLVVMTAGCRGKMGQTASLRRNMLVYKQLMPELAQLSPGAIFVIVTDPVELMTFFAVVLGDIPAERVIGIGTMLESAQLRYIISDDMGVHPSSVHAAVYGIHDEWPIPDWPGAHVDGVPLTKVDPYIKQRFDDEPAFMPVRLAGSTKLIVQNKGYVSWSVALGVVEICNAVLRNTMQILPVTTYVKGVSNGEEMHTFVSQPCVVGEDGVAATLNLQTTLESREIFFRAARRCSFLQDHAKALYEAYEGGATSPEPQAPVTAQSL